MKYLRAIIIGVVLAVLFGYFSRPPEPSRAVTRAVTQRVYPPGGFFVSIVNWGQGQNPGSDCPGKYMYPVQTPDGSMFFLECWGKQ